MLLNTNSSIAEKASSQKNTRTKNKKNTDEVKREKSNSSNQNLMAENNSNTKQGSAYKTKNKIYNSKKETISPEPKNNVNTSIAKQNVERNSEGKNDQSASNPKANSSSEKSTETSSATKNETAPNSESLQAKNKEVASNSTPENSESNPQQEENKNSSDQNKSNDEIAKNPIKKDSTNKELPLKTDEKKAELSSVAMPTAAIIKPTTHQFFLSTEVIYSSIKYAIKPNDKAGSIYNQNSNDFTQHFSDGYTPGSYKLLSGSASLNYYYKNKIGFSAGVGFFNLETQVNTKAFASTKTQKVFDHYIYNTDSIPQIIDTAYTQKTLGNYVIVNGDTVSTQDYLNSIRFITIPLSFSYKMQLNRRFSIEPRAGIQIAIPVKSYQLIAIKANEFEYIKTKDHMNPKNLYFDLGIQLGYKIGNNAQLYIRQGYFFRNKSIYNSDYALDYSLKSIYTTFGISIRLK